jgi:hypothetical protein
MGHGSPKEESVTIISPQDGGTIQKSHTTPIQYFTKRISILLSIYYVMSILYTIVDGFIDIF